MPEALGAQSQFVVQKSVESGDRQTVVLRVACTACASCVFFPLSLQGREFVVCSIMHGTCMAQVKERLEICFGVSCTQRIVCFVLAFIHDLACRSHLLLVGLF